MCTYYAVNSPIRKKITLTTSQETQMSSKPIPACCKILNPFLYFVSSPAAVIIWNPPQSKIINAMNANIPNIRLIAVFTVVMSLSHASAVDPGTVGLYVVFCASNWA